MQSQQSYRIDLGDLKAQIVKRIGVDRSKRYFYYLNQFLSQKLGKSDFGKLCYRMLGRENLPLHNQFIRSILKNACQAKTPPPICELGPAKSVLQATELSPSIEDVHDQNGSIIHNQNQSSSIWSNGVPHVSPRKARSGIRDRKIKDRPSPLGPNGKVESLYHHSTTEDSDTKIITENGNLIPRDYQRSLNIPQGGTRLPEKDRGVLIQQAIDKMACTKNEAGIAVMEDGEEVEQAALSGFSGTPLLAPLGIPFCSASIGGARKAMPLGNPDEIISYHDIGELCDTETLRRRMQHIGVAQGIGGVSIESANILNIMLDGYLKRLIKSCIELAGAKSATDSLSQRVQKSRIPDKVLNGTWHASNYLNMQNSVAVGMKEKKSPPSISLLDFKAAMELNPQQLGEEWPLLLEKVSLRSFEK